MNQGNTFMADLLASYEGNEVNFLRDAIDWINSRAESANEGKSYSVLLSEYVFHCAKNN